MTKRELKRRRLLVALINSDGPEKFLLPPGTACGSESFPDGDLCYRCGWSWWCHEDWVCPSLPHTCMWGKRRWVAEKIEKVLVRRKR